MPLTREECDYASCYCEENVYRLAERLGGQQPEGKLYAVFISNPNRTVPLFEQAAAKDRPYVIWDYHVVLLEENTTAAIAGHRIWDLDTKLPFPCSAETYFERTIEPRISVSDEYRRFFRVIPAAAYLENFSSDRSHMLKEDGTYSMPPPSWPAIQSVPTDTLQKMISMRQDELAEISIVYDEDAFRKKFCCNTGS